MLFCTQYAQKVIVGNDKGGKKVLQLVLDRDFLKERYSAPVYTCFDEWQ